MGRKVKINQTLSYITYVVKEGVTIDLDDYPELEGMSNDEIIEYLDDNSDDMKPTNEDSYYTLSEELVDKDNIKEKIYDEHYSYSVEDSEE